MFAGSLSLALAACATGSRPDSRTLDVPPSTVAPSEPQPATSAQLMVDSATSMIGQPYRYGGAAPGGFDCSGLVSFAAANAGIRVPRTAAEQMETGLPVARSDLQAGDLVFMHLSGKELHVAIALDRQLFVHAPSSGGRVRIDSLLAPPYAGGFIGARRVVSSRPPSKDVL
ncbi:MAG TPA: C40 family peptidase [Steroidobacteraceae bacterium]|nr:C40 family peptidase [Steroidobacteraceae bacterium]